MSSKTWQKLDASVLISKLKEKPLITKIAVTFKRNHRIYNSRVNETAISITCTWSDSPQIYKIIFELRNAYYTNYELNRSYYFTIPTLQKIVSALVDLFVMIYIFQLDFISHSIHVRAWVWNYSIVMMCMEYSTCKHYSS